MSKALAYYNHGRWISDCPADGCTDAREVYSPQTGIRQSEDVCAAGHHFRIEMPPPDVEAQIVAAVAQRPNAADRSWYPAGHRRATLQGFPTGQSVAELLAENAEVAEYRAAERAAQDAQLRELLSARGIAIRPDGTLEGSL